MHCIQYIATQADSTQEAFDDVKSHLEGFLGDDPFTAGSATWYDWFVTGGGRWSTDDDPYNDNYTADVVHQSDSKFQEHLDKAKEFRQTSLKEYVEQATKVDYNKIINDIDVSGGDDFRAGMELYPIKKLYDMALGIWDYNSYFFDIVNDSANRIHMLEAIDNGADNWYLVPVDFHF
jgi:hypothetical protein